MLPVDLKEMYHLLFTNEERDSERWSDKSRITQPADEGTCTRTWLPTPITGFLSLTWKFTPHLNLGTRSWWLESLFSGSFSLWSGFPASRANRAVKQSHSLWERHGALGWCLLGCCSCWQTTTFYMDPSPLHGKTPELTDLSEGWEPI